jgi:Bacterial Ig domain
MLRAQGDQGICGASPCLNRPQPGDTHISGKISAGTKIDIKRDNNKIASSVGLKDGTFTATVDPLNPGEKVEVDQTDTKAVVGIITVLQPGGGICGDNSQVPCVDQPAKDATLITGKATSGATVEIKVDGSSVGTTTVLKDGTFSVAVDSLTEGSKIELDQDGVVVITLTVPPTGLCGEKEHLPCIDQPVEGATQVTGKAVNGAKLDIKIKTGKVESKPASVAAQQDGTFSLRINALTLGQDVQVAQTLPTAVTIGPISTNPAGICGKTQPPCLNQPIEGAKQVTGMAANGAGITVKVNNESAGSTTALKDGTFSVTVNPLTQIDKVEVDQTSPQLVILGPDPVSASSGGTSSSLYTLGLTGINVTSTSTSGPKQQYFAEFDLIAPVHWLGRGCWRPATDSNGKQLPPVKGKTVRDDEIYPLAGRCWVWLNPRIASVPSEASTALSSIGSTSSLTQGIGSQSLGQITQTFEFQAGLEYYVIKPWYGALFGSNDSWAKTTVSLILGGGTVTPFNATSTASEFGLNNNLGQQFNQSVLSGEKPSLPSLYPQLAAALCNFGFTGSPNVTCPNPAVPGVKTIAFVFPNRSRFYRDYFGGVRLRTFYFKGNCQKAANGLTLATGDPCKPTDNYPGTFDARFGEDETVTGGKLRGVVLTLTGSYPLPGTSGALRIFGATYLRLHKNKNATALILIPSTNFTSLDDASVVAQPIQPSDQDYFRLGVGVDLVALIHKLHVPQ